MDTSRQETASDTELAECIRFCNDLQEQLRHARAEQDHIRQLLQSRLSSVLQESTHIRRELDSQLNEAQQQLQAQHERICYLESVIKAEREERILCDEARQKDFEACLSEARVRETQLLADSDLQHQAAIAMLQGEIETLQNALTITEASLRVEAQSRAESLNRQEERHMTELLAAREQLEASQAELQRMRESFLWRLTTPLRRLISSL